MSAPERGYPALGSGVWLVLVRNEWFKARHRLAFVVTLGFFAFINFMDFGNDFMRARREADFTHALPDAWSGVFSDDSVILLIFASIAVIMLVSSEFSWRTARQSVIDGLSKTQWFWGKTILLLLVGLVFVGTKLLIGAGTAGLGTDFGAAAGAAVPASVFVATGGLLLAFFSLGSLALLVSVTVRNSGPAMALWFFWITLGEQLLPALVTKALPASAPVFGFLPFSAAQKVLPFWVYDAPTYARMVEQAQAAEQAAPELPNLMLWIGVNGGWAVFFVALAFSLFGRRDL
jgi:ABC-type transport system involved in multi-copper enzyme maturation permease subunit